MVFTNAGVTFVVTTLRMGVSIQVCASTTTAALNVAMWRSQMCVRAAVMTPLRPGLTMKLKITLLTSALNALLQPTRCCGLRADADERRADAAYELVQPTS